MQKFQLVLLIHAHQPVGNFEDVFESSYAKSYLPFLETLARHPSVHIGLHYSGSLLEWIERAHPEYFGRLREMVNREQVEIVGGGFYEPILIAVPAEDRHEQITRLAGYVEKHFERRPAGAWLAERVWEPELPSTLAPAGVEYTLVDDNHFLGAGFDLEQLHGYYIAEDQGHKVKMLAGLKSLRYLIPFRGVDEIAQFLRKTSVEHPGGFAAMGDDLEKFGVWPGTLRPLLQEWLAGELLQIAGGQLGLDGNVNSVECDFVPCAAGSCRSSDRVLHRDDGMVVADTRAKPLPRADGGVFFATQRLALSSRRNLAGFLQKV